jgi:hypothetical protein
MLSDDQLRAAAGIFEATMNEKADPESDKWDPRFVGYDVPFTMLELAEAIISEKPEEKKPMVHLRINDKDGHLVGYLDIEPQVVPHEAHDFYQRLAEDIQKNFPFPIHLMVGTKLF